LPAALGIWAIGRRPSTVPEFASVALISIPSCLIDVATEFRFAPVAWTETLTLDP